MGIDSRPRLTRNVERTYKAILTPRSFGQGWDRSRALFAIHFAKRWRSRRIDLKAIQRIVLASGDPEAAILCAVDVPGQNVRRLQGVVLRNGTPAQLREFAERVPGADKGLLEKMAVVREVMEL